MALPTYISLFSGAAGLELALRVAMPDSRCVCYVEREVEAAGILAARIADKALDDAPIWSDVTTFDGKPWRGLVDGIAGGFPCTNLSVAGKREGIQRGNSSGLFYEYARIVREVEPRWVYIENVPAVLAFPAGGIVLGELAAMGFDVEWGTLRASDVGASHRRHRKFILAYRRGAGRQQIFGSASGNEGANEGRCPYSRHVAAGICGELETPDVADGNGAWGSQPSGSIRAERGWPSDGRGAVADSGCDAMRGSAGLGEETGGRARPPLTGSGSHVVDAECPERRAHTDRRAGRIPRADREGQETSRAGERGDEMAVAGGERGETEISGPVTWDEGFAGIFEHHSDDVGCFALGPADEHWADVLVRYPWMRPALSQAEAESPVCRVADGMASVLDGRIDRLRACGNGVVPLQGAAALRELMRRVTNE